MFRSLLLSLALVLAAGVALAATPAETTLAGLSHVAFPAPHRVAVPSLCRYLAMMSEQ